MVELFYLLLAIVFGGYFALAGYDYGVGVLLRITGRTDTQRRLVLGALGPFFLGNEVWLVAGLGLMIGAFPLGEGALLSGLYPVLVPLMVAIPVFTAGVQIRSRAAAARPAWDMAIVLSAGVITVGWGVALGAMLQGFPVRFGPLPVVMGALTTVLFTLHGATLLVVRTTDGPRVRARRMARRMGASATLLATAAAATAVAEAHEAVSTVTLIVLFGLLLVAVVAANRLHRIGRGGAALVATGIAAALPVVTVGAACLPYMYLHRDAASSIPLATAAASDASLEFLAVSAIPVLPVLMAFQVATWWIWRRTPQHPEFY